MMIWNQDRDLICKRDDARMRTEAVVNDGSFYGINLLMGSVLLGTFDSAGEALKEMERIIDCKDEVCVVSGHSDYNGKDDMDDLLLYVDSISQEEYNELAN